MSSFKITGIDGLNKLSKELDSLAKKAKALDGTKQIRLVDLFTRRFMEENTEFSTIDELFDAGGFVVKSQSDLDNIDVDTLDAHIAETTDFDTWGELMQSAGVEYARTQLGL